MQLTEWEKAMIDHPHIHKFKYDDAKGGHYCVECGMPFENTILEGDR